MESSFNYYSDTPLPPGVTVEAARALLHNHKAVIDFSPLVIKSDRTLTPLNDPAPFLDPATAVSYNVTDKISYLPFHIWDGLIEYQCSFEDHPFGYKSKVWAAAGTIIEGICQIVESMDGEWVLKEEAIVTCNVLLKPLIESTFRASHEKLHVQFMETLRRQQLERQGKDRYA